MTPEQNMMRYALSGFSDKKALSEAACDISKRISEAVSPINPITAPLLIHILNLYINGIENIMPGASIAAKAFDDTQSITIAIPQKK